MSSETDRLIKGLAKTLDETQKKKSSPYDTEAIVRRVEGDIAWVHIPGGIDETPVQLSMNAVKGDSVKVRVSGGRAWITGNTSKPPTDDATAKKANKTAAKAYSKADEAYEDAELAKTSAEVAREAAGAATAILDDMEEAAEQAETSLTQIFSDTKLARESAETAQNAASTAVNGMDLVQRVVDTANWIAKHGTYVLTTDTEPIEGKFYFIYNTSTNTYSIATPREGDNPQQLGWYEMGSINESVSNFISTHMVLLNDGLVLQNGTTRLYLDTTQQNPGVRIETNGQQVAYYGNGAIIGDKDNVHIEVTDTRLSFYDGVKEVAYVDGQKLYITQTVVLQQMDIGDSDLGVWTWYVHEVAGQNNLSLKWLG